jgi:hypothetical protein
VAWTCVLSRHLSPYLPYISVSYQKTGTKMYVSANSIMGLTLSIFHLKLLKYRMYCHSCLHKSDPMSGDWNKERASMSVTFIHATTGGCRRHYAITSVMSFVQSLIIATPRQFPHLLSSDEFYGIACNNNSSLSVCIHVLPVVY